MLQRLIHCVRLNVFESARFYYWVLAVLTFHLIVRLSIIKIVTVNGGSEWLFSKIITAILYGSVYGICLVSVVLLRKRIAKHFLYVWLLISFISVFNEFLFYSKNIISYDFISSLTAGQLFTNIKITFTLIFIGVYHALNNNNILHQDFLKIILKLTLLNSVVVLSGFIFDISFFESYPGSPRWGFSGFLSREYSVVLSSIFLIDLLKKERFYKIKPLLLLFALIASGTKAGLLSVFLIVFFVFIKSLKIRFLIVFVISFLILSLPQWMSRLVALNDFWYEVYQSHGSWGVVFSLRNESFIKFIDLVNNNYHPVNWIIGGEIRIENLRVEMLLFDLFCFYGVLGVLTILYLFLKIIPSLKESIPVLVALFSGGIITGGFLFICYGVWLISKKVF